MIFNVASRIISNIILFDINNATRGIISHGAFAVSPIRDVEKKNCSAKHVITVQSSIRKVGIGIDLENFTDDEELLLQSHFKHMTTDTAKILRILLKKNIQVNYEYYRDKTCIRDTNKQITVSFINGSIEKYITLLIPSGFFILINRKIQKTDSSDEIEKAIIEFFIEARWNLPDITYILTTLSTTELNKLFNLLQRSNLLTPYQLLLLINAYPEHSLRIKKSLSKNIINDVLYLKRNYEKSRNIGLTRRDYAEGIYSTQEAIYFMMLADSDFNYSRFLHDTQSLIVSAVHNELLLKMTFMEWISEIEKNGVIYETLTITDESTIAQAVSDDTSFYLEIFGRYISKRKLSSIRTLSNKEYSFNEKRNAQIVFILNYRKVKIQRINPTQESFDYLMSKFVDNHDYRKLLLTVGWFVFSTALKDARKKTVQRILDSLPYAQKCLIADVLKGTVNPNVLHDEMQVKRSKKACVNAVMTLYEEGLIDLEN